MERMMKILLVILLGTIFWGGCVSKIDLKKEKSILLKTDQEFAQKSKEIGAAEAFYLFMDEDGIQLPSVGKQIVGRNAIRESMTSEHPYQLLWTPRLAEVSETADMGWTWGTYEYISSDDDGNPINRKGKYLNVWKKQSDGSWKVIADIGNLEPYN